MDPNTPTLPPSVSHASVDEFLTLWALKDPIYLDYEANGYAGNFCHVSAKHMAQVKGGSRIHGWGLLAISRHHRRRFSQCLGR